MSRSHVCYACHNSGFLCFCLWVLGVTGRCEGILKCSDAVACLWPSVSAQWRVQLCGGEKTLATAN